MRASVDGRIEELQCQVVGPHGVDGEADEVHPRGISDIGVEATLKNSDKARETIAFLERVVGGPAYLLGHSDGAVVALLTARASYSCPTLRPTPITSAGPAFPNTVKHPETAAPGSPRRDTGEVAEFMALSLWASVDAIRAFAGDDIDAAVLYSEDERCFSC